MSWELRYLPSTCSQHCLLTQRDLVRLDKLTRTQIGLFRRLQPYETLREDRGKEIRKIALSHAAHHIHILNLRVMLTETCRRQLQGRLTEPETEQFEQVILQLRTDIFSQEIRKQALHLATSGSDTLSAFQSAASVRARYESLDEVEERAERLIDTKNVVEL
jgi:hypothetical protein